MCSPCMTVSSPVLTTAVMSCGGATETSPLSIRAAPTPPARATIIAEPYPRRPADRYAARPVPTVALDTTPLLGQRTGIGVAVAGFAQHLAARGDLDLVGYGLTARGWRSVGDHLP